jgi:MFS family permease
LLPLVFISGMASLGVEFGASRLLAPYFGTSLYVWGVLIGLILVYLSAGYVIGGRLADRHPRAEVLYQITAWAGLWIGIIPLVSYPILLLSQQGFKEISVGLVLGTLLAVVVLFAAPVILLGCVSPFAIRLLLRDVETGGNTAGRVYALSTAGSILGTFLPVFWFIPTYGTRPTLVGFGLALVGISIAGLWPRRRLYASFAAAVILVWIFLPSGIKPPQVGQLLYEKESAYGYIQVVRDGTKTELILNEGEAARGITCWWPTPSDPRRRPRWRRRTSPSLGWPAERLLASTQRLTGQACRSRASRSTLTSSRSRVVTSISTSRTSIRWSRMRGTGSTRRPRSTT